MGIKLTATDVRDLRAVSQAIAIHPESFDMEYWLSSGRCGTTLCIGGHLAVLRGIRIMENGDFECIPMVGSGWVPWIYIRDYWPIKLRLRYHYALTADDRCGMVSAAQDAIEEFIRQYASPEVLREAESEPITVDRSIFEREYALAR